MYHIPDSTGKPYEVPSTPSANDLPAIKSEDLGYFGALLTDVVEEDLTPQEVKE